MTTHGGARKGAGRKPKGNAVVTRSICMPDALWALFDAKKGHLSRGAYLASLLAKLDTKKTR